MVDDYRGGDPAVPDFGKGTTMTQKIRHMDNEERSVLTDLVDETVARVHQIVTDKAELVICMAKNPFQEATLGTSFMMAITASVVKGCGEYVAMERFMHKIVADPKADADAILFGALIAAAAATMLPDRSPVDVANEDFEKIRGYRLVMPTTWEDAQVVNHRRS
jgi:hypothetical protein